MTLNAGKYSRSITLQCPTCGNTGFSHDGVDGQPGELLSCDNCGLEISKDDLTRANGENMQAHIKEIREAVVKDVHKELHESLKKAFAGNKHVKIQ
ncbi:hypothetical protein [Burkholderia sp. SCN-KJ]|uniref:ECs_2282 family putative zinc-binding protein n=1 Tax=Burkholderia sp. SCN-KJ TaxID=2969248 RepID=UPI00214F763B|nr:hypothetical protein [Burkholderia sp. SCN-KJ]MCR4467947.1 hypothetical protein [Burkholderia sp. SCN-KJ]